MQKPFSPEFSSFHPPVVMDRVVRQGAAKLGGYISKASRERLRQGNHNSAWACPEIRPILQYLTGRSNAGNHDRTQVSKFTREPADSQADSHRDYENNEWGITLLMPLSGPRALFAASNEGGFSMNFRIDAGEPAGVRYEGHCPELLWEYGAGDIIVGRQNIASLNGVSVDINAADHLGACAGTREMVIVRTRLRDLSLPGVTVPMEVRSTID